MPRSRLPEANHFISIAVSTHMLQLDFTDRVLIYESDSDRANDFIKSGIASRRLADGSASIHSRDSRGRVSAIRAVICRKSPKDLESVRPGSFGIHEQRVKPNARREALCDGGRIFDHKNTMGGFGSPSARLPVPVVLV